MVLARLSKLPQGEDKDRERKAGLRCLAMLSALLSLLQQPSHLAGHVRPGSLSAMADLSRRCHIQASHSSCSASQDTSALGS